MTMTEHSVAVNPVVRMDLERFLKILRIELEHLCEHIDLMVDGYHRKQRTHEVTERVCHENVAVLQNEECGCVRFMQVVDAMDPAAYADLDALVADVRAQFMRILEHSGLAWAAYGFADRKILKVERYVRDES